MFIARIVVLFLVATTVSAAEIEDRGAVCPMAGGCLRLNGEIGPQDAEWFAALEERTRGLLTRELFIEINSNGGDVASALSIGRVLRKMGGIVIVGPGSTCASSCVFVLAGSRQRGIVGAVAIHRPYMTSVGYKSFEKTQEEYSQLVAAIRLYLGEMNIPLSLLDAMLQVPPETYVVLSEEDLTKYGLNQEDSASREQSDAMQASQFGVSRTEYLRRKALADEKCRHLAENFSTAREALECENFIKRTGVAPSSGSDAE